MKARRGICNQQGFTLLEVLIALTICAIALVSLFSVIAGSKQLTFRAQDLLARNNALADLVNLSLLIDPHGGLLIEEPGSNYRINLIADELEVPDRKTDASTETLYEYEIEDAQGDVLLRGTYWVSLDEAE